MALKKQITLDNGISVEYHRIERIDIRTNQIILISVISYLNEDQRKKEKEYKPDESSLNIFKKEWIKENEYKEEYSISKAYEYLKTIDPFLDAKDC